MSKPFTASVMAVVTVGALSACTSTSAHHASSPGSAAATTSSSSSSTTPSSTTQTQTQTQTATPSTSWLDDGAEPTEANSGDPFSAYTQHGKAPLHMQSCTDASKLYTHQGVLYMCTRLHGGGNAYEEVVKCSDETAADRPNVGGGAKKESRKVKPTSVTVYPKLPSSDLRYELGYFQTGGFKTTASGTYIYGPGQKPDRSKTVDIPTYVSPDAKDSDAKETVSRVCFN